MKSFLTSSILFYYFILPGYAQEGNTRYFYNENMSAELKTINIINESNKEIDFSLKLNNNQFFKSTNAIIDFILNMEDEFDNEPIVRKVWRFSRDLRYHNVPLAEHCWYSSNPSTLFNSTGFGFCGDIAAINYILWKKLGYEARYWGLGGIHVVSEVFNKGKWEMYDSDVEVYYLNRKFEVASVEDLENDISLIYDPVIKLDFDTINKFNLDPNFVNYPFNAYSSIVAAAYESPNKSVYDDERFCFLNNYTEPKSGYSDRIILPPYSKIEFLGKTAKAPVVSPFNKNAGWEINHYANLKLSIDKPWIGKLNFLPLIIQDISGSGKIKISGNNGFKLINDIYEIGSTELNELLKNYWMPLDGLELHVEGQVQITYLVNKKLFPIEQFNYLFLEGNNLDGLHVENFEDIPNLAIDYIKESSNFCEGESVELTFQHLPDFIYEWSYNEEKLDNVTNTLYAKKSGKYSLKVISPWGDEIPILKSYNVDLHKIPEFEFTDIEKIYHGDLLDLSIEVKDALMKLDPSYTIDWYFNGEKLISKSILKPAIKIVKSGNYHIVVTNGKCTMQSSPIFIKSLDTENDFQDFNISIFPNPFQQYFNFEKVQINDSDTNLTVEVFNSLGKKVIEFEVPVDVSSIKVDASNLSNDLYLVRITGKEIKTIRLIKN